MLINHPEVTIATDKYTLKGFDTISIQKSLGSLYSEFDLTIADRRLKDAEPPVNMRERCAVKVGNHLIDTGFIDHMGHSFSKDGSFFEIYGRSLSCDVEESSIELAKNEFKGTQDFKTIADKLLKPFSLELTLDQGLTDLKLTDWKIDPGERVGENLCRAAKKLEILLYSLPNGRLFASKVSQSEKNIPQIMQGKNIIESSKYVDHTELYGKYIVKSNTEIDGEMKPISGTVEYPHITKSRVLTLSYDGLASKKECQKMAGWEMMVRQANSFQYSVKVPGWLNSESLPWELNTLVLLDCEKIKTHENLLVTEISMDYSKEEGHTTYLELRYPDALKPKPFAPKSKKDEDYKKMIKALGY